MKKFMVMLSMVMTMAVAILGGICYTQNQEIAVLKAKNEATFGKWQEEFHRNNELSMENEELSANLKSTTDRKNELYQQLVVHR